MCFLITRTFRQSLHNWTSERLVLGHGLIITGSLLRDCHCDFPILLPCFATGLFQMVELMLGLAGSCCKEGRRVLERQTTTGADLQFVFIFAYQQILKEAVKNTRDYDICVLTLCLQNQCITTLYHKHHVQTIWRIKHQFVFDRRLEGPYNTFIVKAFYFTGAYFSLVLVCSCPATTFVSRNFHSQPKSLH